MMLRKLGRVRLAMLSTIIALTATSCSSGEGEQVPKWVRAPPQYLSCGGMVDPQLMVDLVRAADLRKPEREDSSSELDLSEPSLECGVLGSEIGMLINHQPTGSLAGAFSPPDPLLVPLGTLPGFVTFNWANMWVPCTRGSEMSILRASVNIQMPQQVNPKARLAMARLMVDMTNGARKRFGCSEGSLPLPEKLPEIPYPDPVRWEETEDHGGSCNANILTRLPNATPDDQQVWLFETPEPSRLLSTCEVRVGAGVADDHEAPGHRRLAVVTYRGVLARAYQNSPKHAMPRYDITCRGKPVSYRAYVQDPDGGGYIQADEKLQEHSASAAAYHDDCHLPEQ
ncbi:hypothetical protein [Haloactinomyces albus]|uniref:Uncharacterized protein n=1 Tax=Haloactinomyces albus TaxID=1352928 RepID=A0AAE3ZHV6_9ACTN|nr:hypothetical protein [Haloactinomyces albus]MDR7304201.1 hypothetical protein [Haloactinomyces albus]